MKWLNKLFCIECPNCRSALDLHRDPDYCIICSDPRTGIARGWVWRWVWLHRLLVSRHNFKQVRSRDVHPSVMG